jgi:hypothetical protein
MAKATFIRLPGPEHKVGLRLLNDVKDGIQAELQSKTAPRHIAHRANITSTWNDDKPQFGVHVSKEARQIVLSVKLTGGLPRENKGNWKWVWLNDGVKIRHAVMTPDFSPKTAKGRAVSTKGSGGVWFVNKKIFRPPIEAREFDEDIGKRDRPRLLQDIFRGIGKGFSK